MLYILYNIWSSVFILITVHIASLQLRFYERGPINQFKWFFLNRVSILLFWDSVILFYYLLFVTFSSCFDISIFIALISYHWDDSFKRTEFFKLYLNMERIFILFTFLIFRFALYQYSFLLKALVTLKGDNHFCHERAITRHATSGFNRSWKRPIHRCPDKCSGNVKESKFSTQSL